MDNYWNFSRSLLSITLGFAAACTLTACNSSTIDGAIDAIENEIEGVDRRPIDTSRLGINSFVNDSRFGSIDAQFAEVRDTLRIPHVRVLIGWDDGVQPSPQAAPNFGFYDDIVDSLPAGIDALLVVTHIPTWMENSANWDNGDPRQTFVNRFLVPVVDRYRANGRVIGVQIWNEPNDTGNPENSVMGFINNAPQYVTMLTAAHAATKSRAPGMFVLNAATTAINQNFPSSLDYNRSMRDAGARAYTDRWAIHYYGKQYERVLQGDGVRDFVNGLGMGVWITESGAQGVNSQLAYGEEAWPFLIDEMPSIERIYIYQHTEATPSDVTFGLRNLTGGSELSDLFVSLRDR